ncbi:probable DNA helicase II homolog [Chrysoperla carnea]|uniref:probable DNA helicase II homolog n=2 Tax=cellular organisms TaxID=131567 RepID=UPI001D068021|nr:probable DNA helicase II homolog [Chrysoperla carnea]
MLASLSKNICCVGDDDQSIYGWRGAEVGNILRFEKDFLNATIIKLEQNYKSTLPILAAASNVINNNKNRHGKTLWTDKESGEKIKIISCWNDKEEAIYIASEIARLVREGRYSAGNIAILVRAGFQTRSFEEAFINSAMPYKIIGGLRFYERMEIRDVLAYIRIALNQNDNLALERIINVPKRAIGAATLNKIKTYAIEKNISNFAAIKEMLENGEIKTKSYETLKDLVTKISNWHERFCFDAPINVTKAILDDSGYLEMLQEEKTEEALGRIENINEMLRVIAVFNDIHDFIEHSSLVMENEVLETNYGGSITIMTLHGAKGLEFDVVFLPGWEEGVFPSQRSLDEEGEKGLEEERRIAYVGITRAKKELYITNAESRVIRKFDQYQSLVPKDLSFLDQPLQYVQNFGGALDLGYDLIRSYLKEERIQNLVDSINENAKQNAAITTKQNRKKIKLYAAKIEGNLKGFRVSLDLESMKPVLNEFNDQDINTLTNAINESLVEVSNNKIPAEIYTEKLLEAVIEKLPNSLSQQKLQQCKEFIHSGGKNKKTYTESEMDRKEISKAAEDSVNQLTERLDKILKKVKCKDYLEEKLEQSVNKYAALSDEYVKKEIDNKIFSNALTNEQIAACLTKLMNKTVEPKRS